MNLEQIIVASLSPDLLHPKYQHLKDVHPTAGHCYVASEAYYHLAGGKDVGLTPKSIKHEGATHWYIESCKGLIVDITSEQFKTPVPYHLGRGRGFCTKEPSKRALKLIEENKEKLIELAQTLIRVETLDREEFETLMNRAPQEIEPEPISEPAPSD